MAKFFVMVDKIGYRKYYDLYVCDNDTPIPTAKEIVERLKINSACAHNKVKKVSRLRWFLLLMGTYASYIFSQNADDLAEYAPNEGLLHFWEWWDNEEDI